MPLSSPTIQKGLSWVRQAGTAVLTAVYALGVPAQPVGQVSTVTPAINTLIAIPFFTGRGGSIDRLLFEVSGAGAAGSAARVGIYTNTSPTLFYPDKLVVDGGNFDATSATVKTSTIDVTLPQVTMYWAVYLCGVAAPTVRAVSGPGVTNLLGFPSTLGAAAYTELSVAQAYGALPSTFPSGATPASASVPLIAVRYAT